MQCSDFTFPRSSSRFFIIPSNPSIIGRRQIIGRDRSLISIPNTQPYSSSSLSIKSTASGITDGSFYDLHGVSKSGSMAEIKRAYKKLALKYHPDVSSSAEEEHTKRFIRVREAYETLSDPMKRAMYDRDVVRGLRVSFSARRRCHADEGISEKSGWKNCWQYQILELKRRSMDKDSRHNLSWGARMRRQMNGYI